MPVIKNQHYERNFALFDKTGLDFDNRLSWAAKGILAYVLAKPAGWEVNVIDLINRSVDGKTIVYNALKELRHFGYATYKTERNDSWQVEKPCYYIYARPNDNPEPENPTTIPLGKKHQGTDKRKHYSGGKRQKQTPLSEFLKALENQAKSPRSEFLKAGKPCSEFLNLEILKDKKNNVQGCKNNNFSWENVLKILEHQTNRASFNTWLRPTQLVAITDKEVVIGVPDEVFVYWLQEYYTSKIQAVLTDVLGKSLEIKFQIIEKTIEEKQ